MGAGGGVGGGTLRVEDVWTRGGVGGAGFTAEEAGWRVEGFRYLSGVIERMTTVMAEPRVTPSVKERRYFDRHGSNRVWRRKPRRSANKTGERSGGRGGEGRRR